MSLHSLHADNAIEKRCRGSAWRNTQHRAWKKSAAPVPIEEIVEKHLKLRVEFDDLHRLLGVPMAGG